MAATLADVLPIEILPEIDRRELASHMTLRKFKQDEVVYHQGDPAAHWFVVFEGLIKVLLLDENGRELLISLHSRGEFFGELVIFEDKVPRDGTAVCVIPTSVFQIERDGSLAVLRRNEEAQKHIALYRESFDRDQQQQFRSRSRQAELNLARARLSERRFEEALAQFNRLPDDPEALRGAAQALTALGRYVDAVRKLERAVELDPKDSALRDELDAARERAGKK